MEKSNWRSFEEARNFVRSLQLKNQKEWFAWLKTDAKPVDIPADPYKIYKDKGWNGMGDWLGTERIANQNRVYRSFEEARAFARSLQLNSGKEWLSWVKTGKRPDDIPTNPLQYYSKHGEWISWGDWLGTGRVANQRRMHRSFEEARIFVHTLQLSDIEKWKDWAKTEARPEDIPITPNEVYASKGWVNWGDWLGTGRVAVSKRTYRSFEEARTFVHTLDFNIRDQWVEWAKTDNKPEDIPANPERFYNRSGDWVSWGDWLGNGTISNQNRVYRTFEEARKYVHQLQLNGKVEYLQWTKTKARPHDIPANPVSVYQKSGDWISWGDWLGTGRVANQNLVYRQFEEAREFVHTLQLNSRQEWQDWIESGKKPDDIPAHPNVVYKDEGWKNLRDWLGSELVHNRDRVYRQFEEARAFVHTLHLNNQQNWNDWAKTKSRPEDIPANPAHIPLVMEG